MAGLTHSALAAWTTEGQRELKEKAIYGAVSMDLVTVVEGIKYAEKLDYFTTSPKMQAYQKCTAHNSSGDAGTFAQITLTVDNPTYEDEFCFKDLESKSLRRFLKKGQKVDENTASELMNTLLNNYVAETAKQMEAALWQSSKTQGGSNTNFKQFNGLLQTLETAGGYVNSQTVAGTSHTSITTSNVIAIFQNQWQATPADIKRRDDLLTVCGDDTFDKLIIALTNANLYHYTTDASIPSREITLPGTGMKIKAVPGLNADNNAALPALFKNRIITYRKDQALFGTDMESDMENIDLWYEKKDKKVYFEMPFKATTGWFFPDQVVSFATA